MARFDSWLLPEGVEEVLPPEAARLESLRRTILDSFYGWGYELVIPPLIEYLESLLTGMGRDLELQTVKVIDQMNGRMMGVRADMTPQVARIDAHRLKRDLPTRLCYLGPVLHSLPAGLGASRNPFQVGAELYGHAGCESDMEILALMIETLKIVGISAIHIDLGHIGIFHGLMEFTGLDKERQNQFFDLLRRKANDEVRACLTEWQVPAEHCQMLMALLECNGDATILTKARQHFRMAPASVLSALNDLENLTRFVQNRTPEINLHIDLAELRGHDYHTGLLYAAYYPGQGQALARGGRYDDVGRVFGRARPATGFSIDLKTLAELAPKSPATSTGVYAPWPDKPELAVAIERLRRDGLRVVCSLPGQAGSAREMGCDRQLQFQNGRWVIVPIPNLAD